MRFVKKRWKELECLNAKMRRSKVCYREKSSIQWRKGNRTSVVEMNQNSFIDKVYSLFTSHFSLKLKHSVAPIIKLASILLEALVLLELF